MVPRLDRLGPGSQQAHTVVATATSYLPEAVGGYLRLPRDFADRRVVVQGQDVADGARATSSTCSGSRWTRSPTPSRAQDANALVAHGAFLAEKFERLVARAGPRAPAVDTPQVERP